MLAWESGKILKKGHFTLAYYNLLYLFLVSMTLSLFDWQVKLQKSFRDNSNLFIKTRLCKVGTTDMQQKQGSGESKAQPNLKYGAVPSSNYSFDRKNNKIIDELSVSKPIL